MNTYSRHTKNYLVALLTEKGITSDVENYMEVDGHFGLTYKMQIDFICETPNEMQEKIRKTFVKIDFLNGDVLHYWNHLTQGMLASLNY